MLKESALIFPLKDLRLIDTIARSTNVEKYLSIKIP